MHSQEKRSAETALELVTSALSDSPKHSPYKIIVDTDILLEIASELRMLLEEKPVTWRVFCDHCDFFLVDLDSRRLAVTSGRAHVNEEHADSEEWEFRVQGILT